MQWKLPSYISILIFLTPSQEALHIQQYICSKQPVQRNQVPIYEYLGMKLFLKIALLGFPSIKIDIAGLTPREGTLSKKIQRILYVKGLTTHHLMENQLGRKRISSLPQRGGGEPHSLNGRSTRLFQGIISKETFTYDLAKFFLQGGTPPPLSGKSVREKKVFFLGGKGGYPHPPKTRHLLSFSRNYFPKRAENDIFFH